MATSIRTEIEVGDPGDCKVAKATADTDTAIDHVRRCSVTDAEGILAEEFVLDAQTNVETTDDEEIFDFDDRQIVRFHRECDNGECVCDCVETFGCPIENVRAKNGILTVSFFARDVEMIRDIVTDLKDHFGSVHVRQLTRDDERTDEDLVFVDRNRLTERQREVLEASYDQGYFDHPKGANAKEVADELDIAPSTFSEHLAAAQRKILESVLQSA